MEEKVLKLLTLDDDPKGIEELALKAIKDNPIDIYTDYRDFEGIERFIGDCDNLYDFEDKIVESYDQWLYEETQAMTSPIIDELHKAYQFDELSDSLYEYLVELINDNVIINYPFDDFLRQEVKVNLLVTFAHSTDAEEVDLDYKTLSKMLLKLGYVQPKTIIKECKEGTHNKEDKFLDSLHTEIINAYPSQFNYLTFIGTISVKEYFALKDHPRSCNIVVGKQNYCGFFDPYNGGGSTFAIDLQGDFSFRGDCIHKFMLEGYDKYTVNDVYGMTGGCFQPIKVIDHSPKGDK